jgi:hypothetical protein
MSRALTIKKLKKVTLFRRLGMRMTEKSFLHKQTEEEEEEEQEGENEE